MTTPLTILCAALFIVCAAFALALFVHARETGRCEHGMRNDLACAQCDEPAWCPMCEGPCFDETDDLDERRLP